MLGGAASRDGRDRCAGTSIYQQLDKQARERLPDIMNLLAKRRDAAENRN